MPSTQPVVLTIAGFDPCSGAGATADIKTIAAHGCYAVACITALTVQSTKGVQQVQPVGSALVASTLVELAKDFRIAAVRIGMLGSSDVVDVVAEFIKSTKAPNVVLDPVFRSSSGASLLEEKGIDGVRKLLLPLSTVITPNADEATTLTGLPVNTVPQMKAAAAKLHELGAKSVVVTGGDANGASPDKAIDLLSIAPSNGGQPEQTQFASERLRSKSTHGTGCAFASALAANLALGKNLNDAVVLAKAYVKKAISTAYGLGKGTGPLNHLYRLEEPARLPHEPAQAAQEH